MPSTRSGYSRVRARRLVSVWLAVSLSGCATLMTEKSQTVRVSTVPSGRSVYYQGSPVRDGDYVKVRRDFRTPRFGLERGEEPAAVDMEYSAEPWIIGDAGLALFFIIPGVIAGGVDVATGAWRKLESTQVIDIETARAAIEEEAKDREETREIKRAPAGMKQQVEAGAQDTRRDRDVPEAAEPDASSPTVSSPDPEPRTPEDYAPEEGIVSWYDPEEGYTTASGEPFDPRAMTAAHRTLPFGTRVRVTRLDTNYSVVVTVNDRGPAVEGRIIDLARRPAEKLGLPDVGIAPCRVEVVGLPDS